MHPLSPDRIIERRQALGLRQTDLAQRAGVDPASLSLYEGKKRDMRGTGLIKLDFCLRALEENPFPEKEEVVALRAELAALEARLHQLKTGLKRGRAA